MSDALRALWRRYRALSGRAQLIVGLAVVVALVIAAAAVGGSPRRPAGRVVAATSTISPAPPTTSVLASTPTTSLAQPPPPPTTTMAPAGSNREPGSCHVSGSGLYVLPDPACTPGVTNPDVTQADIGTTICASGWTATIRPPESYTEPLKIEQLSAYGETGAVSSYEEDHLISLELGGSPRDPRNLWPEPGASPNPKDEVENAARRAVCDGRMTLAAAQQAIAADWIALGRQLGVTAATTPPPSATAPPTATASGCSPTTASGSCYRAGEYCPKADRGVTGTDAGGHPITCEDVGGTWRWE